MRTLKKALSLVLVLAMVFALAVPGFAANTTKKASDFKDYSKVTNKEAVDVLTAIGVINGCKGVVSRQAMEEYVQQFAES